MLYEQDNNSNGYGKRYRGTTSVERLLVYLQRLTWLGPDRRKTVAEYGEALTCGVGFRSVDYAVLGKFPLTASGNSPQRTIVSTARPNAWATPVTDLDADIVVVTQNGEIALEKIT
jgi:hypothetical protein